VAAGQRHTACLSTDGQVFCFGLGNMIQLGQGNQENVNTPQLVSDLPPIAAVECGEFSTLCVSRDGSLWAFGDNRAGQLGLGHTRGVLVPTRVMTNVQ